MIPPLRGVRVKIDRAKKHFADLQAAVTAFESRKPYSFTMEIDSQTGYEIYRYRQSEPIPVEWGAIIGDCIHNLRSSLDLLANELVISNGGKPTRYTNFPVGSDLANFESIVESALLGANADAIKLVRELKPYDGGDTALYSLHQLDIRDKHRLIVPVAAAHSVIAAKFDMRPPGAQHFPQGRWLTGPPLDRKFPLKDGDQILSYNRAPSDMNDQTEFNFGFEIAFGEGEVFKGEPVVPTLKQLVDFVEGTINIFARNIFKAAW